ncbi:MAG: hypothetical protein H6934_04440 [Burkholderiaceae bacterium]|nr:hypothetical protein [Burkholderiaceae bacterium]
MIEHWMRTDEREDVLSSLKLFIESQRMAESDDSYWKWSVISLHSAVQSAMAFHLSVGNDLLVMAQEDAEAWLTAHYNDPAYPETRMDGFLNLYRKIKANPVLGYKFSPKGQQGRSIKALNTLRNEFIHFMPKGWSIELSGMPGIFQDCLGIVSELGQANVARWEDEVQFESFRRLVEKAIEVAISHESH